MFILPVTLELDCQSELTYEEQLLRKFNKYKNNHRKLIKIFFKEFKKYNKLINTALKHKDKKMCQIYSDKIKQLFKAYDLELNNTISAINIINDETRYVKPNDYKEIYVDFNNMK